jgi:hypothetical protein
MAAVSKLDNVLSSADYEGLDGYEEFVKHQLLA